MIGKEACEGDIQVSCQQTRFHILEDSRSNDIDVDGLNITVISPEQNGHENGNASKSARRKANRSQAKELISGAHLKLKAGVHYGFVGRNGTGKSTLLKALSRGLIPGIPLHIRIASLVQTAEHELSKSEADGGTQTVLNFVVHGDTYRNEILREHKILTDSINNQDPFATVRAFRQLQHEELERQALEVQKMAKARSGARGFEARKTLVKYEGKVAASLSKREKLDEDTDADIIADETQKAVDMLAALETKLDADGLSSREVEARAQYILKGLGFKEEKFLQTFSSLSGGWKMRTLLAAALTQSSDVLILDEPTNFLDLSGIVWLEQYLASVDAGKLVIIVSHDRTFLNNTCSELILLRDKDLSYFAGNLDSYDESVRAETLRLTRTKEAQERQMEHMSQTIADSKKKGVRTGDDSKLRQAKSRQKKLDERIGMEVNAKGGRFKLNRDLAGWHESKRNAIEVPKEEQMVNISLPPAAELKVAGALMALERAYFKYPKAQNYTLRDINLVVPPSSRLCVGGLNGAGKSTLVGLLVDQLKLSSGNITRHPRLKIGYFSQHAVDSLKLEQRNALDIISDSNPDYDAHKLLGSLGLRAFEVPANKLSGGQAARLALAQVVLDSPHLLVLDEPTTHLDLPTVEALGDALKSWNGAVILVTHDRAFMRGFSKEIFEVRNGRLVAKRMDEWEKGLG